MPHYENVPFDVPEGWCWVKMEDYVFGVTDGDHQPPPQANEGVPFLVISDVNTGKICFNKSRFVEESYFSSLPDNRKASKGDLLFTVTGSYGIVIPVETEREFCFQRHIGLIKVIADSSWLKYVLMSKYVQAYCDKVATGTAQKTVGLAMLRELLIPIPPLSEQQRIISVIERCLLLVDDVRTSTIELKDRIVKAKNRILDLAIHGKLVPQDPNDEPASELLKRINPKAIASCDNPQYGKVPPSWVISTVGEVFTINPKTHVEDDTEAAFVPMTCVADGYSNTFEYECRKWGDIKKGFVHFQENDVAVAKISPCLENRKSVVFHNLPNGIGAGTTELNVFRCGEILPEYALFYFKSQMFIGSCAGTYNGVVGQQRVAKSFIQELPIGIPPYKEQLRIVSKVNDLFSQLDMIEKSLQA